MPSQIGRPGHNRPCGQTLIETILVLALAGFIIQAGAFSWNRLAPKYRLQSAVWEAHTALNQARFKAAWEGAPVRVRFEPHGYALERYDMSAKVWRLSRSGLLEGVDIAANNAPTFYPEGTVSDLATILVSNVRGGYKLTIAISGRIKVAKVG